MDLGPAFFKQGPVYDDTRGEREAAAAAAGAGEARRSLSFDSLGAYDSVAGAEAEDDRVGGGFDVDDDDGDDDVDDVEEDVEEEDEEEPVYRSYMPTTATKLMDGLFVGSLEAARDLYFMQSNKITRVINCSGHTVPNVMARFGVKYLTYRWPDQATVGVSEFDTTGRRVQSIFRFVEGARSKGESVLVHSYDGTSRSVAAVMAYLVRKFEWSLQRCLEFVRVKRPESNPRQYLLRQLSRSVAALGLARQAQTPSLDGAACASTEWYDQVGSKEEAVVRNTFLNSLFIHYERPSRGGGGGGAKKRQRRAGSARRAPRRARRADTAASRTRRLLWRDEAHQPQQSQQQQQQQQQRDAGRLRPATAAARVRPRSAAAHPLERGNPNLEAPPTRSRHATHERRAEGPSPKPILKRAQPAPGPEATGAAAAATAPPPPAVDVDAEEEADKAAAAAAAASATPPPPEQQQQHRTETASGEGRGESTAAQAAPGEHGAEGVRSASLAVAALSLSSESLRQAWGTEPPQRRRESGDAPKPGRLVPSRSADAPLSEESLVGGGADAAPPRPRKATASAATAATPPRREAEPAPRSAVESTVRNYYLKRESEDPSAAARRVSLPRSSYQPPVSSGSSSRFSRGGGSAGRYDLKLRASQAASAPTYSPSPYSAAASAASSYRPRSAASLLSQLAATAASPPPSGASAASSGSAARRAGSPLARGSLRRSPSPRTFVSYGSAAKRSSSSSLGGGVVGFSAGGPAPAPVRRSSSARRSRGAGGH